MSSREREGVDLQGLIEKLIGEVAKELKTATREKSLHTLVTDLLRLVDARKEMAPERVKEVRVRWMDPTTEESSKD